MPSNYVSDRTMLLTPSGWSTARSPTFGTSAVAIDRHGSPTVVDIAINQVGGSNRGVVIGSESSASEFAEITRVLASDGTRYIAGDIVTDGKIGQTKWETVGTSITSNNTVTDWQLVWSALERASSFADDGVVALKAQHRCDMDTLARFSTEQVSSQVYIILRRDEIKEAVLNYDDDLLLDLARGWLWNWDTDKLEIDVANLPWLAWISAMYVAKDEYAVCEYDSLQHSAFVYLTSSRSASPITRGRCAFYTGERDVVKVEWEDASTALVASGFILPAA